MYSTIKAHSRGLFLLLLTGLLAGLLAGCGNGKGESAAQDSQNAAKPTQANTPTAANPPQISSDPVTLTISTTTSAGMSDDDFKRLLTDPVKKKYPNITLNLVRRGKGMELEDQIAAGNTPDMIMIWNGQMPKIRELDVLTDMTPLLKKFNTDVNRFDPLAIDAIRVVSPKGELYGLPYTQQLNALYYNKNIFDKFGVDYPKDGMTWDDAIALAKKVTRSDGGVDYRGLDPESVVRLSFPLSIYSVDAKTNKASVDTDLWRKAFDVGYRIYTIPGNGRAGFFEFGSKQTVAMHVGINMFDRLAEAAKSGFTNWDVAQYPSYKEKPNTFGMVDVHVMMITKTSKHKDQDMQVIDTLTSDEVQTIAVRDSLRATPLANIAIKNQFGQGNPLFKDKHIASIFKSHPGPAPVSSDYDGGNIVKEEFENYVAGKKDMNTSIRDSTERINESIAEKQ